MMTIRRSQDRGYFENNWLKSFHSFSFGEYFDRQHMSFRDLRVINHDIIAPSSGFGTHPHRDMEILTYVLRGRVEHGDSMGNREVVTAGEVQLMSAGTGVAHSEHNPDAKEPLELLQIWILPAQVGLKPSYEQKRFSVDDKRNKLKLLVSPERQEGSLKIHQDVKVYGSWLEPQREVSYDIPAGRAAWLQVALGKIQVNGEILSKGDGASIQPGTENQLKIRAIEDSDFVLFDLK